MLSQQEIDKLVKDEEIRLIAKRIKKLAWKADEWKKAPELVLVDCDRLAEYLYTLEKRLEALEKSKLIKR